MPKPYLYIMKLSLKLQHNSMKQYLNLYYACQGSLFFPVLFYSNKILFMTIDFKIHLIFETHFSKNTVLEESITLTNSFMLYYCETL